MDKDGKANYCRHEERPSWMWGTILSHCSGGGTKGTHPDMRSMITWYVKKSVSITVLRSMAITMWTKTKRVIVFRSVSSTEPTKILVVKVERLTTVSTRSGHLECDVGDRFVTSAWDEWNTPWHQIDVHTMRNTDGKKKHIVARKTFFRVSHQLSRFH